MLPFAPGITGCYVGQDNKLSLELRSLRQPHIKTFVTKNKTVINTIKGEFSPILEDYLGDSLPGFSDAFMEMQSHPIPIDGEEREFEIFNGVKMKFCWIPAGEAQLGSPEEEQDYITKNFLKGERPYWLYDENEFVRGKFKTQGFWLGKYPVTQAQWKAVMGKNPSQFKGINLPVENVNWKDCQRFIKKCSVFGFKVQSPHEDQWEYACRGGKGNKQAFYWGNALNGDKANCDGSDPYGTDNKGAYLEKTTDVGGYEQVAPHPWNLCDMSGNVWEWCENLYTKENSSRVIRGGSCLGGSWFCRSSLRRWYFPWYHSGSLGFRLIIC